MKGRRGKFHMEEEKAMWPLRSDDAASSQGMLAATSNWNVQGTYLLATCWFQPSKTDFWTSGPQNFEGISFCCLKSPRLWYLIAEAPGNEEIMSLLISEHILHVPLSVSIYSSQNGMPLKHLKHQLRAFSSINHVKSLMRKFCRFRCFLLFELLLWWSGNRLERTGCGEFQASEQVFWA